MSLTKNFVSVLLLGVVVTILAWVVGLLVPVFIIYNSLAVVFVVLDLFVTPNPKKIQVFRNKETHLYFKTDNQIPLTVKNKSGSRIKVELKDESLRHFNFLSSNMWHTIEPGSTTEFSYDVMPTKRGSFDTKYVYVRVTGILGLCVKHAKIPCPTRFKVYPNVRDLSKFRLMVQQSRKLPQGDKSLRLFGSGAEFESLRTYVEGDDYRKINWSATARENKLIVNQYQPERDQPVYIMLDTGRPMSYMVNGFKKLDYAINAAIILTDIVNQQGDKAGLLVFESEVHAHIKPGQGAAHRNNVLEALYHVEDTKNTANYGAAFKALNEKQKRRSLVFIFTDFEIIDEADDLIANIKHIKRRHMPIVVFIKNEELAQMATQENPDTIYNKTLQSVAEEFHKERQSVVSKLNAMGIATIVTEAENFAISAVNKYLQSLVI